MRGDTTKVLIAGGGVAALEAALALRALAGGRAAVELLAPEPVFWYRPMSVAEPFGLGEAHRFDLGELAALMGASFTPGSLTGIDPSRRLARTTAGEIGYDALLIASGAEPRPAVPGALTFRGPADTEAVQHLLARVEAGEIRRLAFVVPAGAVWTLPLYELALMTAARVAGLGLSNTEVVESLLAQHEIEVHTGAYADAFHEGSLVLADGAVPADAAIALPRLRGGRINGIPQTVEGFVPVDAHALVVGLSDVYAAGDITSFPVKQGGIAAQQAEVAAQSIAAAAGADVTPEVFRPVLRGVLLTGGAPRYLRREITGGFGETSSATTEPLWWPPAKIVGRYLAPFLAGVAGVEAPPVAAAPPGAVEVRVELEPAAVEAASPPRPPLTGERAVDDVMNADPVVVAPEDTLGEIAEKLGERDAGSALVCDYGRLVGILTSRDLLRAYAERVHPSEGRAREWMTAEPMTAPPGTSLEEARLVMSEYGFHHLPVVDGDGRPLGVVGLRDTVRAFPATESRVHIGLGL
jgi:sulfide:quinone oxidoreductase